MQAFWRARGWPTRVAIIIFVHELYRAHPPKVDPRCSWLLNKMDRSLPNIIFSSTASHPRAVGVGGHGAVNPVTVRVSQTSIRTRFRVHTGWCALLKDHGLFFLV